MQNISRTPVSPANTLQPDVDLHCHVLPDWDDGPSSFEKTLELLTGAVAAGIRQIAVTPHVGRPLPNITEHPAQQIPAAVAALEQKVREHGIDIHLMPGAELTFGESELAKRIAVEPWLTLGGHKRYLLIESTFGRWPIFATQFLYQLSLAGVTAIIAHPERLPDVQKDIRILEEAVRMGAIVQLTAHSVAGAEDRRTRKCSQQLLEAGLVGIIASDAHSAKAVWPSQVVSEVQSIVGSAMARQILIDHPQAILEGRHVNISPLPIAPASKSWWSKAKSVFGGRS
jgi:protein-tyrosine phosphatase